MVRSKLWAGRRARRASCVCAMLVLHAEGRHGVALQRGPGDVTLRGTVPGGVIGQESRDEGGAVQDAVDAALVGVPMKQRRVMKFHRACVSGGGHRALQIIEIMSREGSAVPVTWKREGGVKREVKSEYLRGGPGCG